MSDADTKSLEAKIAERIAFLKKVTKFAQMITEERGRLIRKRIGGFHTHTIHELRDFGGFSFLADIGQSEMGGNTVKIWFSSAAESEKLVLEIHWQIAIDEHCQLECFSPEADWQKKILAVIRRSKTIAAQIDRTAVALAERNADLLIKARRTQELEGRARMLLLT